MCSAVLSKDGVKVVIKENTNVCGNRIFMSMGETNYVFPIFCLKFDEMPYLKRCQVLMLIKNPVFDSKCFAAWLCSDIAAVYTGNRVLQRQPVKCLFDPGVPEIPVVAACAFAVSQVNSVFEKNTSIGPIDCKQRIFGAARLKDSGKVYRISCLYMMHQLLDQYARTFIAFCRFPNISEIESFGWYNSFLGIIGIFQDMQGAG